MRDKNPLRILMREIAEINPPNFEVKGYLFKANYFNRNYWYIYNKNALKPKEISIPQAVGDDAMFLAENYNKILDEARKWAEYKKINIEEIEKKTIKAKEILLKKIYKNRSD